MNTAIAAEPSPFEPQPITQSDIDTARRMVRRCGVRDEADDVAQEVVLAFARYSRPILILARCPPAAARRAVLWGFVRRQVAHHLAERARRCAQAGEPVRARDKDEAAQILDRLHGAAPSIEAQILENAPRTLLHAAVDELGVTAPELRAVLRPHLDGLPMPRVAAALAIPEDTAWSRWRHGCDAVRALLRQWAAGEARAAVRMGLDAEKRARAGARAGWGGG